MNMTITESTTTAESMTTAEAMTTTVSTITIVSMTTTASNATQGESIDLQSILVPVFLVFVLSLLIIIASISFLIYKRRQSTSL